MVLAPLWYYFEFDIQNNSLQIDCNHCDIKLILKNFDEIKRLLLNMNNYTLYIVGASTTNQIINFSGIIGNIDINFIYDNVFKNINCNMVTINNYRVNYKNLHINKINSLHLTHYFAINDHEILKNLIEYETTTIVIKIDNILPDILYFKNIEFLKLYVGFDDKINLYLSIFDNCPNLINFDLIIQKVIIDFDFTKIISFIPQNIKKFYLEGPICDIDFLNDIIKTFLPKEQIICIRLDEESYKKINTLCAIYGYDIINDFANNFYCGNSRELIFKNVQTYCKSLQYKCSKKIY